MKKYQFKAEEQLNKLGPEDLDCTYTSVQRLEVPGSLTDNTGDEEACYVVLYSSVDYTMDTVSGTAVFKDMIYVPRNRSISFQGDGAVLMRYGAPAHIDTEFAHLKFEEMDKNPETHKTYGKSDNNTVRDVWHFINDDFNASRLMMGICQGKTGGWTSWPPHEHARQREEVYTYFDMGNAFGVQCVYEDMHDPLCVAMVTDGDTVSVPKGFHPNIGCPAGRISFIYCMVATKPGVREFMDLSIQKEFADTKFE